MPRYERGSFLNKMLWEIEVDGSRWLIRYGKARAKQLDTYTREYPTPDLAKTEAEKLIAQRVGEGYRLVSDEPLVRAQPPASELELQLRANPDDDEVYLVFADWLQAREHPRGRLMALQHRRARASEPERTTLLGEELAVIVQHRFELLGSLAQFGELHLEASWHRGYLDDIHISGDRDGGMTGLQAFGALCELPDAHFLRSLRLGIPDPESEPMFHEIVEQLAANARFLPRLVRLFVGEFEYPDETEMSWAQLGPLEALYPAFPRLEQLILQGGEMTIGALVLPALRHLEVRTGGLSAADLRAITSGTLPALDTLIVWLGDENYGGSVELGDLEPIFAAKTWPELRHLGLCNAAVTDAICASLATAPVAARLETLDLSLGTMTDDGAEQLALGSFPRLRRLDVNANYLTEVGLGRLRALGIEVVSTMQRSADADEGYFVSVGE